MQKVVIIVIFFVHDIYPLVIKDGLQHQHHAAQKSGVLDKTFGSNGVVITNASAFNGNANGADEIIAMIQQQDGKIVVAGASTNSLNHKHFTLARYTKDGLLDSSFGNGGVAITNASAFNNYSDDSDIINAMLQQSDGKIVVGGSSRNNGVNNDGTNRNSDFTLARYTKDGVLDTTFGAGGVTITNASAFNGNPNRDDFIIDMIQQADGKIVAGGYSTNLNNSRDFTLARYSKDGIRDTTFGPNGNGVTITNVSRDFNGLMSGHNTIYGLIQQPDGKIVAAGSSANSNVGRQDFTLVRYTKDGIRDTTFGPNGNGVTVTNASDLNGNVNGNNVINALIQQSDGKIVVAGYSTNVNNIINFTLARYTANGVLDSTFGPNGNGVIVTNASTFNNNDNGHDIIYAMIQTADGKIVVAGYSTNPAGVMNWDSTLARYTANGLLDTTFGVDGVAITNTSAFNGNNDGTDDISAILEQPDGKLVVAGRNAKINDKYDFTLARYTGALHENHSADHKVSHHHASGHGTGLVSRQ